MSAALLKAGQKTGSEWLVVLNLIVKQLFYLVAVQQKMIILCCHLSSNLLESMGC